MAKDQSSSSACDLFLYRSYQEIWQRGEEYERSRKVKLLEHDEKHARAIAHGTHDYAVELKFSNGGISKSCTCPFSKGHSTKRAPCKHMIAAAILWDEARGIARPSEDEVEDTVIPPRLVSREQIETSYTDPLHADLEVMRLAAQEMAFSSRPHARLPIMPKFDGSLKPLTVDEVRRAWKEIERWSRKSSYDMYFCAGEMVAAFCEVVRIIFRRMAVTSPLIGGQILRDAREFHYTLVMECIDDSDGLHAFTEAHLEELHRLLKQRKDVLPEHLPVFQKALKEFCKNRDKY